MIAIDVHEHLTIFKPLSYQHATPKAYIILHVQNCVHVYFMSMGIQVSESQSMYMYGSP